MNLEEIERGIMLLTVENNKKQLFLHGGILYINSAIDHIIIKEKH